MTIPKQLKFNLGFLKKIKLRTTLNLILIAVLLIELFFVYSTLVKNLNPQPLPISSNNIVSLDLKAYSQTTSLIKSLQDFNPSEIITSNNNPFKY